MIQRSAPVDGGVRGHRLGTGSHFWQKSFTSCHNLNDKFKNEILVRPTLKERFNPSIFIFQCHGMSINTFWMIFIFQRRGITITGHFLSTGQSFGHDFYRPFLVLKQVNSHSSSSSRIVDRESTSLQFCGFRSRTSL